MFYLESQLLFDSNDIVFYENECPTYKETFERSFRARSAIGIKYAMISNGLEISFPQNVLWSDEAIKLIKKAKDTEERIVHYEETLLHPANLFYDGIIFGLKYAYNIYTMHTKIPAGIFVSVEYVKQGMAVKHQHTAFSAANVLWKAFEFTPDKPVQYIPKDDSFIFPLADEPIPSGLVSKRESQKISNLRDLGIEPYQKSK